MLISDNPLPSRLHYARANKFAYANCLISLARAPARRFTAKSFGLIIKRKHPMMAICASECIPLSRRWNMPEPFDDFEKIAR